MIIEKYNEWLKNAVEDPDLINELKSVEGKEEEINDRFYCDLAFGTAGLRGVIGAGTNRMNIYIVRKATQGIANYINKHFENGSMAISYDSRIKSDVFARETARVCAANGIKVYIYKELMPVPCLSYAVRYYKTSMGVMVTASHNPAKYNGYKAYGADGCQITDETAAEVLANINALNEFTDIKLMDFEEGVSKGLIQYIGDDCVESFYEQVQKCSLNSDVVASSGFKIVYSPLNGAGNKPVREILKRIGIKTEDLTVVPEQEYPDGNFPTCPYPNPEIRQALEKGLELCIKTGSDLMLATDPDCDRVGIAVKNGDDYKLLTGNEVGALMLYYIASQRKELGRMPKNPICVKTIVTTDLTNRIAEEFGVEVVEILTGFKYIGEQIGLLEEKGEVERFILGFEESYGYLAGPYVRDKDAVVGAMMICEMAAFYATKGKSLVDVLNELYAKYGYYLCTQQSFAFEGETGMNEMQKIMADLQANPLKELEGEKVVLYKDYKAQISVNNITGEKSGTGLPKSSVLSYTLENGNKFIIRPSGTEPKIKFYFFVKAADEASARAAEKVLAENCTKLLKA